MKIKKFNTFLKESLDSSVDIDQESSKIIKETPELTNLISKRKIEIKNGKLNYNASDIETVDLLKTYLNLDLEEKK